MERKVLFVASTFSHIRNFHRPYLREFAARGWTVHIACGGGPLEIPEADRSISLPLEKSMTSPRNLSAARQLRQEIRRGNYTLVSCHTALASFFTRLALLGMGHRPKVACICHGYLFDENTSAPKRMLLAAAEALTAPVTDLLLTMNHWDTDYAMAHRLGKRIAYIPGMGVDFSQQEHSCPEGETALRQTLGFDAEHFLIVYAAEFSPRKDQATLIRALAKLPERAVLLLPGNGALLEACKALAAELGLSHRVIFPGYVTNMAPWYAVDAVAASSRSEGLPFNVMEAMYHGLPAVVSNVKGHWDLVNPERTGLLFPFGNADACATQLRRLMNDPELALRLGQSAKESLTPYALPIVLPQIMAEYEQLLSQ